MKNKFLIILFMLFISFFANAEKTYRRDHTVCDYNNEKIDIDIRSKEQFTTSEDAEYGNILILSHKDHKTRVNLNDQGIGRYRFSKTYNRICPKIVVFPIEKDQLIFVILKDQRPFADRVVFLYYNTKTHEAEFIETEVSARAVQVNQKSIMIKIARNDCEDRSDSVVINGQKYHYIERAIEPWISFDGVNFKVEHQLSFDKFEHKKYLTKAHFQKIQTLQKSKYRLAINQTIKKSCLSLDQGPWICL